ncbi:uncharacterized protein L201_002152 [Kwoniella dendrophila CBS 6074]|uniref:N-acetyltransferase domain-containing protein n=1 Tax=Kwoniella dendrophila CBS 6074 TaxID=1295534 RepID=A0AAX4JRB6_9TREE
MTHSPSEPTHADIPSTGTSTPNPSSISSAQDQSEKPKFEYTIREGKPENAPAISKLMIEVFNKSFGHSCTPEELLRYNEDVLSPKAIEKDLLNPLCSWLLAFPSSTLSDELLGIVQLTKDSFEPCVTLPNPIELQRIYLSYKSHGTGLSTILMKKAEEKSRELGFKSIWLGAWEDNHRAKKFYEKMGYKTVGDHVFDIGGSKQRDEIMEKSL